MNTDKYAVLQGVIVLFIVQNKMKNFASGGLILNFANPEFSLVCLLIDFYRVHAVKKLPRSTRAQMTCARNDLTGENRTRF